MSPRGRPPILSERETAGASAPLKAMHGRIAVLAWGSLIWDPDGFDSTLERGPGPALAPAARELGGASASGASASGASAWGVWAFGAGPILPLEFSRVSRKRPGALTLVIDPEAGALCRTAAAVSRRGHLAEAAADLARRERAPRERIGVWPAPTDGASARGCAGVAAVGAWAQRQGCAGVVWTGLAGNFADATGASFTLAAAMSHLRALRGAPLAEAARYIALAPPETDTPLRRALASDPWWRETLERLDLPPPQPPL